MKNILFISVLFSFFICEINCFNKKKLFYGTTLTSLIGISLANIYNYQKIKKLNIKDKNTINQKVNQFKKKSIIEKILNYSNFIYLKNKLKLVEIELIKNKYENFDIKNILIKKINNDKLNELNSLLLKLEIDKKNPLILKNKKILENIENAIIIINKSLTNIKNEIENNKKTLKENKKKYENINFYIFELKLLEFEKTINEIIGFPKMISDLEKANFDNLGLNIADKNNMKLQNKKDIKIAENNLILAKIDFIHYKNNLLTELNNIKHLENLIEVENEKKIFEKLYKEFKKKLELYNKNIYNLTIELVKNINDENENESFLEIAKEQLYFSILSTENLIINKSILLFNINENLKIIFNNYINEIKNNFIKKNDNLYEITTSFKNEIQIYDIIKNLNQKYLYEVENLIKAENVSNSIDNYLNNNDAQYIKITKNKKFEIILNLDSGLLLS